MEGTACDQIRMVTRAILAWSPQATRASGIALLNALSGSVARIAAMRQAEGQVQRLVVRRGWLGWAAWTQRRHTVRTLPPAPHYTHPYQHTLGPYSTQPGSHDLSSDRCAHTPHSRVWQEDARSLLQLSQRFASDSSRTAGCGHGRQLPGHAGALSDSRGCGDGGKLDGPLQTWHGN